MWQEAAPAANLSCQHGLLLLRKWLHWFGVLCSWPFKLLTCIVYKTCWVNHWLLSTRYIYYQQLCCFSIDEGHQKYKAEGYWNNGPKANPHLDSADSPINCFPINDDMLLEHMEDNSSQDGQLNLIRSTYIPHQEVTFWKSQINIILPTILSRNTHIYDRHISWEEKQKNKLDIPGIEPGAFQMQSERATTALHPRLSNGNQNWKNIKKFSGHFSKTL